MFNKRIKKKKKYSIKFLELGYVSLMLTGYCTFGWPGSPGTIFVGGTNVSEDHQIRAVIVNQVTLNSEHPVSWFPNGYVNLW